MAPASKQTKPKGKLVVLSGPSCVGKSPLAKAIVRFHPELKARLTPVVLYNSRPPRPGEVDGADYHFRQREEIEDLGKQKRCLVFEVRGDTQGLDLGDLKAKLKKGDVFFEGNPFVGRALVELAVDGNIQCLSMFVSPLSGDELRCLAAEPGVSLERLVTDVMRRKLLRRARNLKGELSLPDLNEVERRAGSAFREMKQAVHFTYVIPNHDGEDSENWDAFYYPLGDARKTFLAVVGLIQGKKALPWVERWANGFPG